MRIKSKRVLKNGAVAGYVYYSDEKKWKWRIVGHINSKKGGFEPKFKPKFRQVCATDRCKTTQKYENIEKHKYSINKKNNPSAQIKARLATLHNTGFLNSYYKKMLKKYEEANKNGNSGGINVIIENLKKHKNKKYKKNVNKNSKREVRKQYLENTIKKMEIKKMENKIKKMEIKKSINTNEFFKYLVTKNREKNNKLVKRELEKRVEFIFKLRQKGLPEPRNESEFQMARVYVNSNNDSIYDIEQWIDALQLKREKILEQLYNFITTLLEKVPGSANNLLPIIIITLNEIKKNNEEIYKKIKKIINKIIDIEIKGEFGYGVTVLCSALTYINQTNQNQTNQNQINKNSNKVNEKLKQHIIDFIKDFDLDLFEKIPDQQIEDFIEKKEDINNNN